MWKMLENAKKNKVKSVGLKPYGFRPNKPRVARIGAPVRLKILKGGNLDVLKIFLHENQYTEESTVTGFPP